MGTRGLLVPYAAVNGTQLYYEVHGEGPPVLFIHGMYGNHASWYQQTAHFSSQFRVVTFNLRGFGLSEDQNDLGASAAADDVRALLDHLQIESTAIVAQSMGGNAGLAFAAKHPERVNALVMAGTLGGVVLPESLKAIQAEVSEKAKDLNLVKRMLSRSFLVAEPAKTELFLQLIGFNRGAATYFSKGIRPEPPSLEVLGALASQVPILFIVGDQDVVLPPEVVATVARTLSMREASIVKDSGHSAYFEQPDVFNARVEQFLTGVMAEMAVV